MADRVGVINNGEIVLVEEKAALMAKLGQRELTLVLENRLDAVPPSLEGYNLALAENGHALVYAFAGEAERARITALLRAIADAGLVFRDLRTSQKSLEDIFVDLVRNGR